MDLNEHCKGAVRADYCWDLTRGIPYPQVGTDADKQCVPIGTALFLSYCFSARTSRSTLMAASVRPVGAT
jgi:hypothetical protein